MSAGIRSENNARAGANGRAARRGEAGSVLLLVVFLAAAMLIAMSVAVPRVVMQGRREKEAELAWRGEQYVRAVRLYYRKFGHFPRTVEDFSKNPGNLHFLRKEYKEPMNSTDGSWRYIYVGPGGQLIGSLTRKMPLGMVALQPGTGGMFGNTPNAGFGAASSSSQPGAAQGGSATSGGANVAGQPPAGDSSSGTGASGDQSGDAPLPPAPVAPNQAIQGASTADSTVFGGQLVGVASKVDRKSIRFYKGYGKYREWEFIWDPAEDAGAAGGLVPVPTGGLLPTGTPPAAAPPIVTPPTGTTPPNPPQ